MNVADMIVQAQVRSEEVYDEPTWIGFINAAIDDLTPVARMLNRIVLVGETPSDGKLIITIAGSDVEDAHEILTVYYESTTPAGRSKQLRRLSLGDNFSMGWKLTSTQLILQGLGTTSAGTVTVDMYKKLTKVDDVLDIPDLPEQYHDLIVKFMCSLSQQKEEELEDKRDFYGEYMLGKNSLALDRIWEVEPHNRKFIRRARIAAAIGQTGTDERR